MCGISGIINKNNGIKSVISSLNKLQNRGYDSAGICTIVNGNILVDKYVSDEKSNAVDKINSSYLTLIESNIAIGHTRWATHGPKTLNNAHPHVDYYSRLSLVHNGIIENYVELSNKLKENNYEFKGQTDSEIVVNYIHYLLSNNLPFTEINKYLVGSWAILVLDKEYPNKIFYTKHGSPLILGFNNDKTKAMFVSEISGFDRDISNYTVISDGDSGYVSIDNISSYDKYFDLPLYDNNCVQFVSSFNNIFLDIPNMKILDTPLPYPHWTIKEINDQPQAITNLLSNRIKINLDNSDLQFELYFPEFELINNDLIETEHIIFLGCGTSYHAAQIGSKFFKDFKSDVTMEVIDGADFEKNDIPTKRKTLLVLLSQSGETRDLYRALQIGKDNHIRTIGFINVENSLIAREVDTVIYLCAGSEIAVASTKSFTNQVIMLLMLAIWMNPNMPTELETTYVNALVNLSNDFRKIIRQSVNEIPNMLHLFENQHDCFILGKQICEWIAKEGSLKIKEISYCHCEGFSASALKHGPFALLVENTPVIMIANNDTFLSKIDNVKSEIKSRLARVIYITNKHTCDNNIDYIFYFNTDSVLFPLLSIVPLQIIAYYLACHKKNNPDYPRNLAKVVTVE